MAWNINDTGPIWMQLMEEVKLRIITGAYPPGSQVPSVRELAASAQVNPNTMQRAMTELEREGYISTQRGNGRFVTMDTMWIAEERRRMAEEELRGCVRHLIQLGVTKNEITAMLSDAVEKEGGEY